MVARPKFITEKHIHAASFPLLRSQSAFVRRSRPRPPLAPLEVGGPAPRRGGARRAARGRCPRRVRERDGATESLCRASALRARRVRAKGNQGALEGAGGARRGEDDGEGYIE